MRKGKAMLGSDNEAVVNSWKEALEVASDILGKHDKFYEVVPYVIDYPTKNYAEQGVAPKPEDFTAEISNKGYMYACKKFGMNPMEVNKVRSSEDWAKIVELAKEHDSRPWNVDLNVDGDLKSIEGAGSKGLSELTEEEMSKLDKNALYGKGKHNPNPAPIPEVHGGYEGAEILDERLSLIHI